MDYQTFEKHLKASSQPVLVEFWAPWCGPCRAMAPALERVKQQFEGQVEIWKINADENQEVLRKLGILGIPTVIVYRNGQRLTQRTGLQSEQDLAGLCRFALGEAEQPRALTRIDRVIRMSAGAALLVMVMSFGATAWLLLPAVLLAFSAVYDRCPIYRAIAPRIRAVLSGQKE